MDWSQLRITRGALIVLGVQVGLSLIWLMGNGEVKLNIEQWVAASPSQVFENYRVWTLITSPLLERGFLSLLLTGLMMWMLVPTLERFWGTPRFLRFVAITSIAGTVAGVVAGQLLGNDVAITGFSPM